MLSRVNTVAFNGLEILNVELQVQISAGMPAFAIVGLPDKAVAESRERIRAAFTALGLKLPAKRITVNLSPADLLKEGSHFDLPLALGLLVGMEVIPQEKVSPYIALGELGLREVGEQDREDAQRRLAVREALEHVGRQDAGEELVAHIEATVVAQALEQGFAGIHAVFKASRAVVDHGGTSPKFGNNRFIVAQSLQKNRVSPQG